MKKQYICIVKIGVDHFCKWHVNNLLKFTDFLDNEHNDWRWFNVYQKRNQIASFTKNNKPITARVQ